MEETQSEASLLARPAAPSDEDALAVQQPSPWLRMDPELTRDVLSKTEEELLGGLAALMRNKVENEKLSRRMAQTVHEIEEARLELARVRRELGAERSLAPAAGGAASSSGPAHPEPFLPDGADGPTGAALREEVQTLQAKRAELVLEVQELRRDVDEKIAVRMALASEIELLGQHLGKGKSTPALTDQAEAAAASSAWPSFDTPVRVDYRWESDVLERELFTDVPLNGSRLATLIAGLPDLGGCLLLRNQGPILGDQFPSHLRSWIEVPEHDLTHLFQALPGKIDDQLFALTRLASFRLPNGCLTVVQAQDLFLLVSHQKARLRPGLPRKLAAIAAEAARLSLHSTVGT